MRMMKLVGLIGIMIGLTLFIIGLITPLPAIPLSGLGVGFMTLSTLSPVFDFTKPKMIITILCVVVYLIGITMVFIGLLTPIGMLPIGMSGIVPVCIGFIVLLRKARRGTD